MRNAALTVAAAVLLALAAPAAAGAWLMPVPPVEDSGFRVATFWVGKKHYDVGGVRFEMDVAPYIRDGRVMLPLRYVGRAVGIEEARWDQSRGAAVIVMRRGARVAGTPGSSGKELVTAEQRVTFVPGERRCLVVWSDGETRERDLDVPAEVAPPGRVMVPLRAAVQEACGAVCVWHAAERAVSVVVPVVDGETWTVTELLWKLDDRPAALLAAMLLGAGTGDRYSTDELRRSLEGAQWWTHLLEKK